MGRKGGSEPRWGVGWGGVAIAHAQPTPLSGAASLFPGVQREFVPLVGTEAEAEVSKRRPTHGPNRKSEEKGKRSQKEVIPGNCVSTKQKVESGHGPALGRGRVGTLSRQT